MVAFADQRHLCVPPIDCRKGPMSRQATLAAAAAAVQAAQFAARTVTRRAGWTGRRACARSEAATAAHRLLPTATLLTFASAQRAERTNTCSRSHDRPASQRRAKGLQRVERRLLYSKQAVATRCLRHLSDSTYKVAGAQQAFRLAGCKSKGDRKR